MVQYALHELVTTDRRFQTSVNLQLDMGNRNKIKDYIPTSAGIAKLQSYLQEMVPQRDAQGMPVHGNATVLIGPYGKGKSHLILVLMEILSGHRTVEMTELIERMRQVNAQAAALAEQAQEQGVRYLPVLISPTGMELNQAFLYALHEALVKAELEDIAPDSYYSEAVRVIREWQEKYPATYQKYLTLLAAEGETADNFLEELQQFHQDKLDYFREIYPALTSGSTFHPILQMEAMKVYLSVNSKLQQKGYAGMVVLFDEFSKYVEGHGNEHFAGDMRILQDICELAAASSGESRIHVILIAHKSIKEYGSHLLPEVRKEFEGVEGRIKERKLVTSGRNHYELIRDAVHKTPLGMQTLHSGVFAEKYQRWTDAAYGVECFHSLFPKKEEYERTIGEGCFPLTPLAAYLLLHISEKVAQNERTVFTFLCNNEYGSLARRIQEHRPPQPYYVGADAIYDYFAGLFKETVSELLIHNEWLKAEYALSKSENAIEKKIIKALALFNMINNTEELPANASTLAMAAGVEFPEAGDALKALETRQLLLFRHRYGIYAFRNNVGIDLDKEIRNIMAALPEKGSLSAQIAEVSDLDFVLPRIYNQQNTMTRYFRYLYLTVEEFLTLPDVDTLLDEAHFADGCLLGLVYENTYDAAAVERKCRELQDERLVILLPQEPFREQKALRKIQAIRKLAQDTEFLASNKVIGQELTLYLEDLLFEINVRLEHYYLPELGHCSVTHMGKRQMDFSDTAQFNRFLSGICEAYYRYAPHVNHELINIRHVDGQYLKARNTVVDAVLNGMDCSCYRTGTSPEAMVFRTTLLYTGIYGNGAGVLQDNGTKRVLHEIHEFLMSCVGARQSFAKLYHILLGPGYGMRSGILPLYLASQLVSLTDMPVIYLHDREVDVSAEILNNLNTRPDEYYLFIEKKNGEKEEYLRELERIFLPEDYQPGMKGQHHRLSAVVQGIQRFYRSLPQYTQHFQDTRGRYTEQEMREIVGFRNIFRRQEINPREAVFEKIPALFGETPDYAFSQDRIHRIYQILSTFLEEEKQLAAAEARKAFGISQKNSLAGGMRDWYARQSRNAKTTIHGSRVSHLMNYLAQLKTNDDAAVAADLSKQVLDLYMEDWEDATAAQYGEALLQTRSEIEALSDVRNSDGGSYKLSFTDSSGNLVERSYDADREDSTSYFLKNAIESAMEDFGDSLETNQKVAVLVQAIEQLLKNK